MWCQRQALHLGGSPAVRHMLLCRRSRAWHQGLTPTSPLCSICSVVETQTGKHKVDKVRTSKGTFLRRGHDAVIANIEERVRLLCVSNKLQQACFAGAKPICTACIADIEERVRSAG